MATNNAVNLKITNNSDGYDVAGGTTSARKLTVTGADITLTGSGTNVYTFPAASDTLLGRASTDTLTNKTYDTAGTGNSFLINGVAVTANTGTGAVARASSPTFVTPTLGAATATSINGLILTASTGTVTITNLKTLAVTNTLTLSGTDSTVMTFPTTTATIARTDAANTFTGHQTIEGVTSTGATGTGKFVFDGTPTLVTPVLGVATATSINKVAITAPATSATLTIADSKTLTASGNVTLSMTGTIAGGGASQTFTLPSTTDTIAALATAQTFTALNTFKQINFTNNAITASANAATVPITHRYQTVTNNSAATLTVTLTTTSAVNGQLLMLEILDFSAVAQTITWVNTEDSSVTAPITSNGSTILPLTVGFKFNSATTKWRTIAKA